MPQILARARESPAASAWNWASERLLRVPEDVLVKVSGCWAEAAEARPAQSVCLAADLVLL